MNVIPKPQKVYLESDRCYRLSGRLTVSSPPEDMAKFELFAGRLLHCCGIQTVFSPANGPAQLRVLRRRGTIPVSGWYCIRIQPDGIQLQSGDGEGLNYALATLLHLLREYPTALPCGEIEDWPAYSYRGQHLDTARHYFPMVEIKRIVEQLSLLKCNILHWNFANDQAWRLESRAYPKLTEHCRDKCYTWQEVRGLIAFAEKRGVTVVPEFEIPGHSSAAVSAYPHLCCSEKRIRVPDSRGVYPYILCAGKPSTYRFIDAILSELLELFPSKLLHLGGDEAPKGEWKKCPHCRKKLHALGLQDFHSLQAHLLNYANTVLRANGRLGICWNEGLLPDNLDKDIRIQYWWEQLGKNYCYPKLTAGREVILSNIFPFYFDYPYSITNLQDVYAYQPRIAGKAIGKTVKIAGFEGALWTESIAAEKRLEYMLFPRVAALAEMAWGSPRDYVDFCRRLAFYYGLFTICGIHAASLEDAGLHGIRRSVSRLLFAGTFVQRYAAMLQSVRKMKKETGWSANA